MNKNEIINKLNNSKLIAHRLGYKMTEYPENSSASIEAIFNNKELLDSCSGFELDICFTKDHIPVVIHDKYIDDISNEKGKVKSYTLEDLKKLSFTFRKSNNIKDDFTFKILSLDELLDYFQNKKYLLKEKIIKIETKEMFFLNKKNLEVLASILNNYKSIANNLVHLSYYPTNLIYLKEIQIKNNFQVTKTDLLCDYNLPILISKISKSIDSISLRIKTADMRKLNKKNNFKDIYDNINDKSNKYTGSKTLNETDTLKIPELNFNLKEEFRDVLDMFSDFFLMIKEVTYDVLVNSVGGESVNLILIGIGAVAVMLILLAIINR